MLDDFRDPETGRSITRMGQVHAVELEADRLGVTLGLTTYSAVLVGIFGRNPVILCHDRENQLTRCDWIYRLAATQPRKPVAYNETADHVPERSVGAFAGG